MLLRISFLLIGVATILRNDVAVVWSSVGKFQYAPGDKATLQLMQTKKVSDLNFEVGKSDLVKATLHSTAGEVDILNAVKAGAKDQVEVTLGKEGTQLITIRSVPLLIDFPADSMNGLMKDFDMEDVSYARTTKNQLTKNAKVMSSWQSALLLQSGSKRDDVYKVSTGFPLEIVPEQNPYTWKVGDKMRFKILWNGKPLFGARVKLRVQLDHSTGLQNIYTGKDGVIEAPLGNKGVWLISVVKMIPSRNPEAEWMSYQSTLSFGY